MNDRLFSSIDWHSVRDNIINDIKKESDGFTPDQILNTNSETTVNYFIDKHRITVPTIDRENIEIDDREVLRTFQDYGRTIQTKITEIIVTVPFQGTAEIFRVRPTTYRMSSPIAKVFPNHLTFTVHAENRNADQIRNEIETTLDDIDFNLNNLRKDVSNIQNQLPDTTRQFVESRRKKLLADRNLVSELGYKLKARSDIPHTFAPPEVRRKITPRFPSRGDEPFRPEPALTGTDYEHILSVISDMATVMERSPSAFANLNEEALRFHFLVPLNGHYEGAATGETFNYQGKTDILIKVDGKNIFIAECKFWGGPKKLSETVDQLLGYASWRDTKTAILIFNRNKNFTKIIDCVPNVIKEHPNYIRTEETSEETQFRYKFQHREDPARELTLTVLMFDIPTI